MNQKVNYYKKSLTVLEELKKDHPSFNLGRHVDTATADYGDVWGMSDKEFYFALQKYQSQLCLDIQDINDDYVKRIVDEAMNLDTILDDEEDDDY